MPTGGLTPIQALKSKIDVDNGKQPWCEDSLFMIQAGKTPGDHAEVWCSEDRSNDFLRSRETARPAFMSEMTPKNGRRNAVQERRLDIDVFA